MDRDTTVIVPGSLLMLGDASACVIVEAYDPQLAGERKGWQVGAYLYPSRRWRETILSVEQLNPYVPGWVHPC